MEGLDILRGNIEEKEFEHEVKSAKALIQTFLQTLKAYRLYEPNHPILSKFLERLRKDFEHYFEEFDSFSLQIGEYNLFFKGKIVYESKDIKESLAFHFFKDGIREIHFIRGLEFEEIVDFLNIVRKSDFINRLEDDLVTLLWERDFSHIIFTVIDEFLEGKANFIPSTVDELHSKLEFTIPLGMGDEKLESNESNSTMINGEVIEILPTTSLVKACQLEPEEIEEIFREVEREENSDYLYIVNNLIEILLHLGEDLDAYENMISYFDRLILSLLENRKLETVLLILKSLSNTMESIVLKDKQVFAIQRILGNPSKPSLIELLGKIINENTGISSDLIHQYLQFISNKAIEPLCLLLKEVRSGKWRKIISDKIAELCKGDINQLVKYLSDPDPFFVSHILYIIGKIGNPNSLRYLDGVIYHKDAKVREIILNLINKFGYKGSELLKRFLEDPVPEIRMKASIMFAKTAKQKAIEPLRQIILSKDFYKRDYQEKLSFFKALSETGSTDVIPILKKIANKRKWFNRAKWNEMRVCAKNTLKMLGVNKL